MKIRTLHIVRDVIDDGVCQNSIIYRHFFKSTADQPWPAEAKESRSSSILHYQMAVNDNIVDDGGVTFVQRW